MSKSIGAALIVIGVVCLAFGVNASESFSSDLSRFFTGAPTDRTLWLFLIGGVCTMAGVLSLVRQH